MSENACINPMKKKLEAGEVVVGALLTYSAHETYFHTLAEAGYDFVMLDCEHGAFGWDQVEHLCRAARLQNFPVILVE